MTSKKPKAAGRRGRTAKKRGARSRGSRSQGEAVSGPPDIHADMLAEFFEATAAFAAAEARFVDTGAFRLDVPAARLEGVVACYVDFDSEGAGFLVLPSVQHYRDLTTAGDQPPRDRSGVLVLLAPPEALPRATRRELEGLGWRRSEDARIPVLTKQGVDGDDQLPAVEDYRVATLAATVMAHVARTTGDELISGNAAYQCTIGIPGWGDVEVLHPGDVDEDELASIDEDAIETTIRLTEEALAAGLGVDVLSSRARRVLERARPAEDAPVVELTASLEELAHVGSLLGAASRQPGRPAILHELSMRLLQASRGPEVWAIDRPPR